MRSLFLLSVLIISVTATAQQISYQVSFPNAVHHEARISVKVTGAKPGALQFRMSRSSPGRYATHEFGKNVYDVTATDAAGSALTVKKIDGDVWEVSGAKGNAVLTYTLYANHPDGTYAGIDGTSMQLNMPATFMWVRGMEKAPMEVTFDVKDPSFTIATQLKPGKNKQHFTAPDLQYFMDSPVKIGKLHWREWQVEQNGKKQSIRIALEAKASEAGVDSLADIVKNITEQAAAVFKEYPVYDHGTYTFLASINPYVKGDGMEHRNSTMIALPMPFSTDPNALEVFSHEYFHSWNVERIRPKTLEPFNFEKSIMSNELWVAEGFTQYYGALLMVRAGLETDTSFKNTAASYVNQKSITPGGSMYTPIDASNMAVFTDAGVSIDKTNYGNIFTSYYFYGASVALALDLTLRSQFNSSLDIYMQELWKRHGKPFIPYTVADLEKVLAGITNAGFAKDFFSKHVYGKQVPDYKSLLAPAGFELVPTAPGAAWIGQMRYSPDKNGLVLNNNTIRNTPLYDAGLDIDDIITALHDAQIRTTADLNKVLAAHRPGDELKIRFMHRGEERTATIRTKENPAVRAVTYEAAGRTVTPAILQFRKDWLGAK